MPNSMRPLSSSRFGVPQARHLLRRAGFGGSEQQVQALAHMGPRGAVEHLLDFAPAIRMPEPDLDPDVKRPMTDEERSAYNRARRERDEAFLAEHNRERGRRRRLDRRMLIDLREWWLDRLVDTPAPLQEQMTLLWHDHFASTHRSVGDTYKLYQQNQMFRHNAAGSFSDLALGVVHDPAMLTFLNNDNNHKRRPNENLARELMELFTLGEGQYTEDDIKQGARALTGYFVDDHHFVFREGAHDDEDKVILGVSGNHNGDDFVHILLQRRETARYIALKLYQHYVADLGDTSAAWPSGVPREHQRAILDLAGLLWQNQYDLRETLHTLLLSQAFYNPENVGNKVKSPVYLATCLRRTTGCPARNRGRVQDALRAAGQDLFNPPTVAGWDRGQDWISTSSLYLRQNLALYLLTGMEPNRRFRDSQIDFDPSPILADLEEHTPQAIANRLCDVMVGEHLPAPRREPITQFIARQDNPTETPQLAATMVLITALPEFQLY